MKKLVWLFCFLIAGTARADEDQRLRLLLFQHHGPPNAAEIKRMVPDAEERLLVWAADEKLNVFLRDRALVALETFGGERVRLLYDRTVDDVRLPPGVRARVLAAYARVFPEQARPLLRRFLRSEDQVLKKVAEINLRDKTGAAPRSR